MHDNSTVIACYGGVGSLLQASFMGSHVVPGFVIVVWVQAGGPGHDQPQPGLLGEDDVQHKHKGRLAVPAHHTSILAQSHSLMLFKFHVIWKFQSGFFVSFLYCAEVPCCLIIKMLGAQV